MFLIHLPVFPMAFGSAKLRLSISAASIRAKLVVCLRAVSIWSWSKGYDDFYGMPLTKYKDIMGIYGNMIFLLYHDIPGNLLQFANWYVPFCEC
jgi:hypothetical protein